ncbi:uncharacterized protein BDZ99DRAFT_468154 [Mytilinidion resinicola]|uniref:Uncharacterized protein n=1 Tax=Mytilinidion resinicola TaxID=574789 RepID=A0A6A6Y530_9PEZI|nr:uncharacterized protein BDZ99DRAFT_468154 [Mytilinidion resinicola]KAF2803628.1 hypothetical protein BDZ99DRAFT_468154 [Mytilinidion resinicola]
MVRLIHTLAGLALTSLAAAVDWKMDVEPYESHDCERPKLGNFDFAHGEHKSVHFNSMRLHATKDHGGYLKQIQAGQLVCTVAVHHDVLNKSPFMKGDLSVRIVNKEAAWKTCIKFADNKPINSLFFKCETTREFKMGEAIPLREKFEGDDPRAFPEGDPRNEQEDD